MRNKRTRGLVKTLGVAVLGFLCVWCGAMAVNTWAKTQGEELLSIPEQEIQQPGVQPMTKGDEAPVLALPDDGIVPFHSQELPQLQATPEPGRATGPVEEITVDGGAEVGGFHVKDTSGSGVNLEEELAQSPTLSLKRDGSVEILIYHTHTSEGYMNRFDGFYYTDMNTRTGDPDKSVVAAGEEMKKALEKQGFGVVHDTTVCDELFNGSYSRSWEVLQNNLAQHPGIQVTIDVHRDSMTTQEGVKYKPTVEINGRKSAQVMLLAGSSANGEWEDFPNWRENLWLDLRVQQALEKKYPGLARPLDFSDCKYNMNATTGSMLVEMGTEVNTVAEAQYAGSLVGEVLGETLLGLGGRGNDSKER